MRDFLKPLIRKKPDEVILHIGTKDVKDNSKTAEVVAAGISSIWVPRLKNLCRVPK